MDGTQHGFLPYKSYYLADPISASTSFKTLDKKVALIPGMQIKLQEWVGKFPLPDGATIHTICEGMIDVTDSSDYCDKRVTSTNYVQDYTLSSSCFGMKATFDSAHSPFSEKELETMRSYFMANINIEGSGGVVASPATQTPGGSYYYHWMRDAALTMRCLQESSNEDDYSNLVPYMKSYIKWVIKTQNDLGPDPHGEDIRTEPKFLLPTAEVLPEWWCRPQNDGPGLRATTLMYTAGNFMKMGLNGYVKEYLWTGDSSKYHGGAIKYDLDYVVSGYNSSSCDLWEEQRSHNFFWNRVTMRRAMIEGARFAEAMGDSESALNYTNTRLLIEEYLFENHFDGKSLIESTNRTMDGAVILGLNHAYLADDDSSSTAEWLEPTSVEVAKTVMSYNALFCDEYKLNIDDTDIAGLPGVLYGRYGGDTYAGGNPWHMTTAALANLLYRAAASTLSHGRPTDAALAVWRKAFNSESVLTTLSDYQLAELYAAQGDGVLLRLRSHVSQDNWHLNEQIDKLYGHQKGASDLTWSYAEVFNAMHQRSLALKAFKAAKAH